MVGFFLIFYALCVLQIANQLDRVVASIGRKPLKVFVQVNTSGEECKLIMFADFVKLLIFSVFFFLICYLQCMINLPVSYEFD